MIVISKGLLLCVAKAIRDGTACDVGDSRGRVGDHLAVLDVQASNLGQVTLIGPIMGDELGHQRQGLVAVHCEAGAVTVKRLGSHTWWNQIHPPRFGML